MVIITDVIRDNGEGGIKISGIFNYLVEDIQTG
jgi:hypothetical protein